MVRKQIEIQIHVGQCFVSDYYSQKVSYDGIIHRYISLERTVLGPIYCIHEGNTVTTALLQSHLTLEHIALFSKISNCGNL